MKTRKGGNLATRFGRAMGIYHEPSTSALMRNFFAILSQLHVNARPILREWVVEDRTSKGRLLLDPRYEQVFLEIYCKVFRKYNPHFFMIVDFETKVKGFLDSKKRQDNAVIETLILYVQTLVSENKKIPENAYDWIMDWIDYMETFKPDPMIANLKKAMKGAGGGTSDPRWDVIFVLPKPPKTPKTVRAGGDPTEPIYVAPDPMVFEIFISIVGFLIKFLIVLLSGGIVNPF